MQSLFALCAVVYLLIYAFEGVIRYGLYNIGASSAILLRDGLILVPLLALLSTQVSRTRVHPAYFAFGAIVALHGSVSLLNFHNVLPPIYGAMLLLPVLFGFITARSLILPSRKVVLLLGLVWVVSIVGVVLDKFFITFPWTGMETHIGGIAVDVSRGWDISDGIAKRAAGFTRSSISAAMMLPTIALILALRIRSYLLRMLMLLITVAAVFMTTQKGSVAAMAVVALILATPGFMRYRLLCWAALGFAVLDVALPIFTSGLLMSDRGGVFSTASFAMRVTGTWPDAWRWISDHNLFPFGVGLGGIGGAQRFFAQDYFNPSDNLFIFLYANFGVLSLLYLGWALWQAWHQPPETQSLAITPLAILVFNLGYGAALSMLEDQVSELFFGASIGMLWLLRQMAAAQPWANPFRAAPARYSAAITYQPHRPVGDAQAADTP
jgi:F0F1-type ATP synthase assembly protein I